MENYSAKYSDLLFELQTLHSELITESYNVEKYHPELMDNLKEIDRITINAIMDVIKTTGIIPEMKIQIMKRGVNELKKRIKQFQSIKCIDDLPQKEIDNAKQFEKEMIELAKNKLISSLYLKKVRVDKLYENSIT